MAKGTFDARHNAVRCPDTASAAADNNDCHVNHQAVLGAFHWGTTFPPALAVTG